jgi:hypothetical protein
MADIDGDCAIRFWQEIPSPLLASAGRRGTLMPVAYCKK